MELTNYFLYLSHSTHGKVPKGKRPTLTVFLPTTFYIVLGTWKAFRKTLLNVCNHLFNLNFIDFQLDFENRCRGIPGDASGPLSGKNLSEVVNNMVWVRQLELKVFVLIKVVKY